MSDEKSRGDSYRSLLRTEGLWIQRDGFTLGYISLEVFAGQCLIVSGPNGSGKSTLLAGLGGHLRIMPGSKVDMFGKRTHGVGGNPHFRRDVLSRIGLQIQGSNLFQGLTVKEHMEFFADIYGRDISGYLQMAEDSPALFSKMDVRYGALSEGMRQVLHFILATGHDPCLVILDEPTSGLDEMNQRWIMGRLQNFLSSGGGVVMSTHNSKDVEELGTNLLVLQDGKQEVLTSAEEYRNTAGYATRLSVKPPHGMAIEEAESALKALEDVVRTVVGEDDNILLFSRLEPGSISRQIIALGEDWIVKEARDIGLGDAFRELCRRETT